MSGKMKLAMGVLVTDEQMFLNNFKNRKVDAYYVVGAPNASDGLNILLDLNEKGGSDVAILVHQDITFPDAWTDNIETCLKQLPHDWLVAGVWGIALHDGEEIPYGNIIDSRMVATLKDGTRKAVGMYNGPLPVEVNALDELCLIINLNCGFRFTKEMLGFDLYGTYACLWAKENGRSAWVIDAPITHHSKRSFSFIPDQAFKNNWRWLHSRFPALPVLSTVYSPEKGIV